MWIAIPTPRIAWAPVVIGLAMATLVGAEPGPAPMPLMLRTNAAGRVGIEVLSASSSNFPGAGPAICRVMPSGAWWPGLVPVYAIERKGRVELRRVAPTGLEGQTDPVGFVVPRLDEPGAASICGRWNVVSRKEDGMVHRLAWELTAWEGRVSGRFDQDTDFRFAFISGGVAGTNAMSFTVEYIQDRYEVSGLFQGEGWSGTWRRPDGSESGTWTALRARPDPAGRWTEPDGELWEWRLGEDGPTWYGVGDLHPPGEGWKRSPKSLGRVWRAR